VLRTRPEPELDRRIAALALPALGAIAAEPAYSLALEVFLVYGVHPGPVRFGLGHGHRPGRGGRVLRRRLPAGGRTSSRWGRGTVSRGSAGDWSLDRMSGTRSPRMDSEAAGTERPVRVLTKFPPWPSPLLPRL
jgi:hypothetical protein